MDGVTVPIRSKETSAPCTMPATTSAKCDLPRLVSTKQAATCGSENCTRRPSSMSQAIAMSSAVKALIKSRLCCNLSRDQPLKITLDCCSLLANVRSAAQDIALQARSSSPATAVIYACPQSTCQQVQKAMPLDIPKQSKIMAASISSTSSAPCNSLLPETSALSLRPNRNHGNNSCHVLNFMSRDARSAQKNSWVPTRNWRGKCACQKLAKSPLATTSSGRNCFSAAAKVAESTTASVESDGCTKGSNTRNLCSSCCSATCAYCPACVAAVATLSAARVNVSPSEESTSAKH
mmetsp:Transcript_134196/g.347564  ORF Transcript_134196/g.347564 Transcript_134196/m.347564 type:complete len:293 (-) Transcript_134196:199-1077(-)